MGHKADWPRSHNVPFLFLCSGIIGYLIVTSWTLNEDLFSLLLANVYSFLVCSFLYT